MRLVPCGMYQLRRLLAWGVGKRPPPRVRGRLWFLVSAFPLVVALLVPAVLSPAVSVGARGCAMRLDERRRVPTWKRLECRVHYVKSRRTSAI